MEEEREYDVRLAGIEPSVEALGCWICTYCCDVVVNVADCCGVVSQRLARCAMPLLFTTNDHSVC